MAIFDSFLYNGEERVLDIRLHELRDVVDCFVIVESTTTFTGRTKALRFKDQARHNDWPMDKIDYRPFVLNSPSTHAWDNELAQRNSLAALLDEVSTTDLILVSDVDEIPRASCVDVVNSDETTSLFGFKLRLSYFRLNFVNIGGPASDVVWTIGLRKQAVRQATFDDLRMGIRDGSIPAKIIDKGGWHFSYLDTDDGIVEKIQSFSHTELATSEILSKINTAQILASSTDLFGRDGFHWSVVHDEDLPTYVLNNRQAFEPWLIST